MYSTHPLTMGTRTHTNSLLVTSLPQQNLPMVPHHLLNVFVIILCDYLPHNFLFCNMEFFVNILICCAVYSTSAFAQIYLSAWNFSIPFIWLTPPNNPLRFFLSIPLSRRHTSTHTSY